MPEGVEEENGETMNPGPTELELRVAKAIYDAGGVGTHGGSDWNNLAATHREVMLRRARAAIAEVHKASSFYRAALPPGTP
jgi:protein involved in polysaccharide export with SLBB domain